MALTDKVEISKCVQAIVEDFDTIDILVNNAGILGENTILLEIDEADWDKVLNVNLKGAFILTQCVLPYMIGNEGGKIVNVSCLAGKDLSLIHICCVMLFAFTIESTVTLYLFAILQRVSPLCTM